MTTTESSLTPHSTMQQILEACPGAQRALFRKYHIGGCSSCAFQPAETLAQVCARNNSLSPEEVLTFIQTSHEEDRKILITPRQLEQWRRDHPDLKLLDVRSRQEYEAVHIESSVLLSQTVMQEIMGRWPRSEPLVIIDHLGKTGLDAAAYFAGHGFEQVRCLQGGIDAWSQEVDPNVQRYQLG
jgi:rhodanese-related sulfurtransferase